MNRPRALALFILAVVSLPLYASDLGLWISRPMLEDAALYRSLDGDRLMQFDEKHGYGVTWNMTLTDRFTVEAGLQRQLSDIELTGALLVPQSGELELTIWSATGQWHFVNGGRFDVYAGGGAAWVTGEFDLTPALDDPLIKTQDEITWLAAGGVTVKITDRLGIGGDVKYIGYDGKSELAGETGGKGITPLVFSLGLRIRF